MLRLWRQESLLSPKAILSATDWDKELASTDREANPGDRYQLKYFNPRTNDFAGELEIGFFNRKTDKYECKIISSSIASGPEDEFNEMGSIIDINKDFLFEMYLQIGE